MKNVVIRSFFTLIANYAQIERLKYWVFGIGNFEISRWNWDFICLYPSHIHFSPALSKHRPNLPVGKVYTKIYVKISIKYSIVISAAEPTSLPFLGSRRLPWNTSETFWIQRRFLCMDQNNIACVWNIVPAICTPNFAGYRKQQKRSAIRKIPRRFFSAQIILS